MIFRTFWIIRLEAEIARKTDDRCAPFLRQVSGRRSSGRSGGLGSHHAHYFDFVYTSQNARFQYPFISLALVPEFGTSFSLPDQVGYLRAAEIVLLGHPFDASNALTVGLVTKILADADCLLRETASALQQRRNCIAEDLRH
jgi:enoyl-CoA hydratase/carnithine racemase